MAQRELICRVCGAGFPPASRYCPDDGGPLFSAETLSRLGMQLERYLIDDVLGEGGRGVVYSARHIALDRPVAVKVLHTAIALRRDAASDFMREARATSRIRHPNIVEVTDFGTTPEGLLFLVMEYVPGESLESWLIREHRMSLFRSANIIYQVAAALRATHEQGIIHRDLKPANVMLFEKQGRRRVVEVEHDSAEPHFSVKPEGRFDFVKVLDFGLARIVEPVKAGEEERSEFVDGTPQYMSPERIMGRAGDERSDVYSLGVVFYKMVTGQLPFQGRDVAEIMHGHVYGNLISPNVRVPGLSLDKTSESTIMGCLAREPDERFQSMRELLDVLPSCFTDRVYLRYADRLSGARQAGITPDHTPAPPSGLYLPRPTACEVRVRSAAFHEHSVLSSMLRDSGLAVPSPTQPPVFILSALAENELVGCVGWERYGHWAVMRSLVVRHELRRQGVGARLVVELCQRLASQGVREVYLAAGGVQVFFERLGFIAVDASMLPAEVINSPTIAVGREAGESCMWHGLKDPDKSA